MAYLKANGVLFQINSGSLLGRYGRKNQKNALTLLKEGWCHIVASDIHRPSDLQYNLDSVYPFLCKKIGRKETEKCLWKTANNILNEI